MLFFAVLYASLQSPGIYSADAGDLVTASFLGTIAHAPGYPTYTSLGYLLLKIKILTPAYLMSFLSSLPSAAALAIIFWGGCLLTGSSLAGLFGALGLGFSYLYWLYAEVQEVFALNNFFIAAVLVLGLVFYSRKKSTGVWYLIAFVSGLSVGNHHTYFLLFPALLFLLVSDFTKAKKWKKYFLLYPQRLFLLTGCFLVGLLPLLYLPLASGNETLQNWGQMQNWGDFYRHLLRVGYGTFRAAQNVSFGWTKGLSSLWAYVYFAFQDLGVGFVLLCLLGWRVLFSRSKITFWYLFIAYIFLGPLFHFYACFPLGSVHNLGIFERFSMASYLVLYLVAAVGFHFLVALVFSGMKKFLPHRETRFLAQLSVVAILLVLPLRLFFLNNQKNDFRHFYGFDNLGKLMLDSAPDRAVFFMAGDTQLFVGQYLHFVSRYREDIDIVNFYMPNEVILYEKNFIQYAGLYKKPQEFLQVMVRDQLQKRAIMSSVKVDFFKDGTFVPWGLVYRLFPNSDLPDPKEVHRHNLKFWESISLEEIYYHDPLKENYLYDNTLRYYYDWLAQMADYQVVNNEFSSARYWLLKMLSVNPQSIVLRQEITHLLILEANCEAAASFIDESALIKKSPTAYWELYRQIYTQCESNEEKAAKAEEELSRILPLQKGGYLEKEIR